MGWRLPIVLNWGKVRCPNECSTTHRGSHSVPEKSCHVKVLREKEDMAEVLYRGRLHCERDTSFRYLFEDELEYVFDVLER